MSNLRLYEVVLLPNPMSMIPYDLYAKNPLSTVNPENLSNFLRISTLSKRQSSSTAVTLTTEQLIKTCPLYALGTNGEVLLGCLAGIVQYCSAGRDWNGCRHYYETVFGNSIFAPIAKCAAWNFGPRSSECWVAVNNFSAKTEYSAIDKGFAGWFSSMIFGSRTYAPCDPTKATCRW